MLVASQILPPHSELQWLSQTDLKEIQLYENEGIAGGIPSELGELPALRHFEALRTSLTGTIPSELDVLASSGVLETFQATFDSFEGNVSAAICNTDSFLVECKVEAECACICKANCTIR